MTHRLLAGREMELPVPTWHLARRASLGRIITSNCRLFISFVLLVALWVVPESTSAAMPGFADTKYVGSENVGGTSGSCKTVTLAALSVTVKTPSRIDGYGAGVYHQNGSNLNVVSLHLELDDAKGQVVAVSNRVSVAEDYSTPVPNNGSAFGAVSGVLYTGSALVFLVTTGGSTPFVAKPGKYVLKLILTPGSSPCPAQSHIDFITLSYQLAGTAP